MNVLTAKMISRTSIRYYLLFSILLTTYLFPLSAQSYGFYSDYRFNQINSFHGLSQSSVLSLCQDKQGFIWLGTKDGLNKFDGYSFNIYKNSPSDPQSISNNEVICLTVDSKGDLLIGTRGGGLNKYVYEKEIFVKPEGIINQNSIVQALFFENDSTIWIGTNTELIKGVTSTENNFGYSFTKIIESSIYHDSLNNLIPHIKPHTSIVSVQSISDSQLIVGTENGVFIYHTDKAIFKKMSLGIVDRSKVTSILRKGLNEYVIGCSKGVFFLKWENDKLLTTEAYSTTQNPDCQLDYDWTNALTIDSTGNIWGGSRGGGLFKIDKELKLHKFRNIIRNESMLSDFIINSLMIDKTGVLWIGTESEGCNMLDLNRKKFQHLDNTINKKTKINNTLITAITGKNDHSIYVGTAYNGIHEIEFLENNRYKLQNIPVVGLPDEKNNEIISLLYDSKQNLWFGSPRNAITKIDQHKRISTFPTSGFVFSILEDKASNIWFGTWGNGFGRIDPSTNEISYFNNVQNSYNSLSSDIVISLHEDSYGNLWIGTKGGGINISPIKLLQQNIGTFASYLYSSTLNDCLSHNDVYCIYQDSNKDIWIGTGNGLNRVIFPPDENPSEAILKGNIKFETYTENDGLPNNLIYGILEDNEKQLWISTVNGLAKLSLDDYSVTRYSIFDGLQNNEYHSNAFFKNENNKMFFGGTNGISFFNPDEIKENVFEANVSITGLKIHNQNVFQGKKIIDRVILNKNISVTKDITLSPKHKDFTIEFSAMHYANINNIKYAYRLLGYNDEWRFTERDEHTANYTNIFEGDYIFQVKATNNIGNWSDLITELKITKNPPLWRNNWSLFFYISLFITLLFFFRKYSIIGVKEKNRLKIEALERKKVVELTEAKTRFFTNISHEIRTPLTLIYSPLESVIQNSNLDETSNKYLHVVKKNVDRLLHLTNQLLQLRKIDIGLVKPHYSQINFTPYMDEILEYFAEQLKQKQITLNYFCQFDDNNDLVWIDREMITTALYNLISNACKYTPPKGTININILHSTTPAIGKVKKRLIRKQPELLADKYMNIEISDNGVGIPSKELPDVFKRFYQAKSNESEEMAGSGIGLSIVKEYIDLHHGHISVSSQVNKGTKFLIQLPTKIDHIPAVSYQKKDIKDILSQNDEHSNIPKISESHKTDFRIDENDERPSVLIADDDNELLEYLEQNLSGKYKIITANTGSKAWSLIQKYKPNLIISDIMMPEINGHDLCSNVKKSEELSHIPVIILSAHAANEDIIEGYEHGADRYIGKPFSIDLLKVQIEQLLVTRQQLIELYSKKILLKPRDITITSADEKFITRIIDLIEENMSKTDFDVSAMVEKMNMSHSTALKRVKLLTGVSLVEFIRRYKINKAAMIFTKDKLPISEVAYMTGFSDPKYFSKCFTKQFKMTPSEYIKGIYDKKS